MGMPGTLSPQVGTPEVPWPAGAAPPAPRGSAGVEAEVAGGCGVGRECKGLPGSSSWVLVLQRRQCPWSEPLLPQEVRMLGGEGGGGSLFRPCPPHKALPNPQAAPPQPKPCPHPQQAVTSAHEEILVRGKPRAVHSLHAAGMLLAAGDRCPHHAGWEGQQQGPCGFVQLHAQQPPLVCIVSAAPVGTPKPCLSLARVLRDGGPGVERAVCSGLGSTWAWAAGGHPASPLAKKRPEALHGSPSKVPGLPASEVTPPRARADWAPVCWGWELLGPAGRGSGSGFTMCCRGAGLRACRGVG